MAGKSYLYNIILLRQVGFSTTCILLVLKLLKSRDLNSVKLANCIHKSFKECYVSKFRKPVGAL